MPGTVPAVIPLDAGGQATIISPNLPEPTEFDGRNYIDLQLPIDGGDWFRHDVQAASEAMPIQPVAAATAATAATASEDDRILALIEGAAGILRIVHHADGSSSFASNQPMSEKLAKLTPQDVLDLAPGHHLILRHSMYGTLTYNVIATGPSYQNAPPLSSAASPDAQLLALIRVRAAAVVEGYSPDIDMTWDAAGTDRSEPSFSGSAPLQLPVIYGTATPDPADTNGKVTSLHLFLDPDLSQPLPTGPNVDLLPYLQPDGTWRTTGTETVLAVSSVGRHHLYLRAMEGTAGRPSVTSLYFHATLSGTGGGNAPHLTITSPADGTTITGAAVPVSVEVTGSATDATGVQAVQLQVDTDPTTTPAQPKSANDWSTWHATLHLTKEGRHVITATCTNVAGHQATQRVAVFVAVKRVVAEIKQRLLLVETYRISSFLGRYGMGRVVKTFTLLPGESTTISVSTFNKVTTTSKSASSILDSFSDQSATDFEDTLTSEQHHDEATKESFKYGVEAQAKGSWGWGSASVKANIAGGTDSSREQFAKTTSSALQKHTSQASAKRDVNITSEYTATSDTEGQTKVERTIKNINVSRVLNFVFRQMNQEIFSLLHLIDMRVAHYKENLMSDGTVETSYREATIPELDSLLQAVIAPGTYTVRFPSASPFFGQGPTFPKWQAAKYLILQENEYIPDYLGNMQQFVEHVNLTDPIGNVIDYWHVNPRLTGTYSAPTTDEQFTVPGVIVRADVHMMRTEGVVADALLGVNQALDDYSQGLQTAAVKQRDLENDRVQADIDKAQLAIAIVKAKDDAQAKIFAEVYPPPPAESEVEVAASENRQLPATTTPS